MPTDIQIIFKRATKSSFTREEAIVYQEIMVGESMD